MVGNAPCGRCGKHIWNIPVDDSTKESDGNGGFWYQVKRTSKCQSCGEPLIWFHVPPPESLAISVAAQHSVQRIGLLARVSEWFGAIANR